LWALALVNWEQQLEKIVYWLQPLLLYQHFAMQQVRVLSSTVVKEIYESALQLQSDCQDFVIQFQWAPH
jgi:hypothetical protein